MRYYVKIIRLKNNLSVVMMTYLADRIQISEFKSLDII